MTQPTAGTLKKTPLHARHRAHGARMVEFGGWDMPVEYTGIADEHMAVRTRAGLFDVSHMGEIEIAGADALKAVQHITSNDASRAGRQPDPVLGADDAAGHVRGRRADLPLADDHFMLVVNASNIVKDFHWIAEHVKEVGGDAVGREHQLALRADGAAGARGEGRAADAHRRGPVGHQVLLVRDRRGRRRARHDLADRLHGRGRVRSVRRRRARPSACGTRSSRPGRAPASSPPASARATRCASKRRCGSTATTWTTRPPWSKPTSTGSSAGRRSRSSAPTC